jgi:hypothetical protein
VAADLQLSGLPEAVIAAVADDDVIQHVHAEQLTGGHEAASQQAAAVAFGLTIGRAHRAAIVVSTIAACEGRGSWRLLVHGIQNQCHGVGEGVPLRSLGRELFTAEACQPVEPGPLAFLG